MSTVRKSHVPGDEHCSSCGITFAGQSMVVDAILAVLKVVVGFLSGSRALLANGLYSINDVLSALIVLLSLKVGRRPADTDHAYGHGKAEFIALAGMSFVLVAGVIFIFYYSLADIVRGEFERPHISGIGVALLTFISCEFQARKAFCCAHHLGNSPAMHTHAEHHRADSISSLAVLVAIIGAYMGLMVLDQIVAIFETVHICWLAGTLFGQSIKGLMDSSLPLIDVDRIKQACSQVEGVIRVTDLRTRSAGFRSWIDVAVALPKELSVAEANQVCHEIRRAIRGSLDQSALEIHVQFKAAQEKSGDMSLSDALPFGEGMPVENG